MTWYFTFAVMIYGGYDKDDRHGLEQSGKGIQTDEKQNIVGCQKQIDRVKYGENIIELFRKEIDAK